MPELPDIKVYVECAEALLKGHVLHRVRPLNPFLLRTALPSIGEADGRRASLQFVGAGGWPEKVTAFHPQMAVHGRHGQPCPVCAAPVQRIVYARNETNSCACCQTGGKLLADRALGRLLKASWPKHIDDV